VEYSRRDEEGGEDDGGNVGCECICGKNEDDLDKFKAPNLLLSPPPPLPPTSEKTPACEEERPRVGGEPVIVVVGFINVNEGAFLRGVEVDGR
jgi:hypothetical protein